MIMIITKKCLDVGMKKKNVKITMKNVKLYKDMGFKEIRQNIAKKNVTKMNKENVNQIIFFQKECK